MSMPLIGSGSRSARSAPVFGASGPVSVGMLCSCTAMSLSSPAGEVIVVQAAGEIDLFTISVLQDALADSLARGPRDLIVDLAAMTFCDVRGLRLLVQTGDPAAARGIGYAVASAPAQTQRAWQALWPVDALPKQFPSAAAGVLAAMAHQVGDDRTRWAPKRGPGWIRRWPAGRPSGAAAGLAARSI